MCDNLDRAKRKCMGAGLYCFWDGDDIFSTSPCHCDNLCRNTSHNLQEIKRMRVRYVIFWNDKWILSTKQYFLPKLSPYFNFINSDVGLRRSGAGVLNRARAKTLKMTVVIVSVFIFCWTPYYIIVLW